MQKCILHSFPIRGYCIAKLWSWAAAHPRTGDEPYWGERWLTNNSTVSFFRIQKGRKLHVSWQHLSTEYIVQHLHVSECWLIELYRRPLLYSTYCTGCTRSLCCIMFVHALINIIQGNQERLETFQNNHICITTASRKYFLTLF